MPNSEKVFVSIYCKVFDDSFSDELRNVLATGDEIYEFLMKDAQLCLDDDGEPIPGDCNLWYLGCNEGFGQIRYSQKLWRWSSGESSFDTVEEFVSNLYGDTLIAKHQLEVLNDKIREGRFVGDTTDIKKYLLGRRQGSSFVPLSRIINTIMKMLRKEDNYAGYNPFQRVRQDTKGNKHA